MRKPLFSSLFAGFRSWGQELWQALPASWRRWWPTALLVLVALGLVSGKFWERLHQPWTRDAQVRAQVVEITPRVSGPIVRLPIRDNQRVKAGDLLFEIDPRTFAAQLGRARAQVANTRVDLRTLTREVEVARAALRQAETVVTSRRSSLRGSEVQFKDAQVNFQRAQRLISTGSISRKLFDDANTQFRVAEARRDEAWAAVQTAERDRLKAEASLQEAISRRGNPGSDNAQLLAAQESEREAALNLEFTRVLAPVSGYVTNLTLRLGSHTVENQPALALVDEQSYWVEAYFRETWISRIAPGDAAVVTLMSDPQRPLQGTVESIGSGIAQSNGSTGDKLLPNVSPTFEWIRLAQRIPVRIEIASTPPGVVLRQGTTASVLIRSGTHA